MFEETPKVDFTVNDENGKVVYRDSITFSSISELRNTSTAERQALFQERYNNWLATKQQLESQSAEDPIPEEG